MKITLPLAIASLLTTTSLSAAHIVTETRAGTVPVKRTHTYTNKSGDLRIDEQGFSASSSANSSAGSTVTSKYTVADIEDTMIFHAKDGAVIALEGNVCRRITADSAPPPGMPSGATMEDTRKQMADAMKQASIAMEQAMKEARAQGMTPEQERAMKQFTEPFTETINPNTESTLRVEALNKKIKVNSYMGEGYQITDEQKGHQYRVWLARAKDIPGGQEVRSATEAMMKVFASYMEKMGGGSLMKSGLSAVFMRDEFADAYPIRIEDLRSGEITDIVEASAASAKVDFNPDCVVKDMFGQ